MAAKNIYVDLDGNWAATQTGLTTGSPLCGPFGFQKAIGSALTAAVAAAGDTVLYEGAVGRVDRLVKFTVGTDKTGTWTVGDTIENHNDGGGANGDDSIGVLCEITATTVLAELSTGYYGNAAIADGIYNATVGAGSEIAGANVSAKATEWIHIDTAVGTIGARLTMKGCPNDDLWTPDGVTRAKLDANGVATKCISANGGADYWTLANLELDDSLVGDNIEFNTGVSAGVNLENIYSHDSDGYGFDLAYLASGAVVRCLAEQNASGFYAESAINLIDCEGLHNTTYGLYANTNMRCLSCLFHGNGVDNVFVVNALVMVNSIIDAAGRHGLNVQSAYPVTLEGCRVTNNGNAASEYGVNMAEITILYLRDTLFTGNRGAILTPLDQDIGGAGAAGVVRLDVGGTDTNILDGAATPDDGYTLVDATHHDFNLTAGARSRSVAALLPDT